MGWKDGREETKACFDVTQAQKSKMLSRFLDGRTRSECSWAPKAMGATERGLLEREREARPGRLIGEWEGADKGM